MLLPSDDPLAVHLAAAAVGGASIVLSLPGVGGVKHHRSRLLGREADGTVWVSTDAVPPKGIDDLMAGGKAVAISFRAPADAAGPGAVTDAAAGSGRKIALSALPRRRASAYCRGKEPPGAALLLQPTRPTPASRSTPCTPRARAA